LTGHGADESAVKILVEEQEGKRLLGKPSKDWRIILKWLLEKMGWNVD
jgi:hypothetical protein